MTTLDFVKTNDADGVISIRWKKADGEWHRTTIAPEANIDTHMASVEANLAAIGAPLQNAAATRAAIVAKISAAFAAIRAIKAQAQGGQP